MADERVYTIPLRDAKKGPRTKRAPRAMRVIKQFLQRHMKSDIIKIHQSINHEIWERGIKKIPSKIRVKATKDENDTVIAELLE